MGGKIEIKEITEIINERKFIDDILATGYIDQVNTGKILVKLAKHYYWDLGYKQTRTVKALDAYKEAIHMELLARCQKFMATLGVPVTAFCRSVNISPTAFYSWKNGTIIPIDHVENYDDFVNQLRQDKKFEQLIQSMTVDRLTGGSSLAKNKYKW